MLKGDRVRSMFAELLSVHIDVVFYLILLCFCFGIDEYLKVLEVHSFKGS
jgi:hypothetical protein